MKEALKAIENWAITMTLVAIICCGTLILGFVMYGDIYDRLDNIESKLHTPIEQTIRVRDSLCITLQDSINKLNTKIERNETWIKVLERDVREWYIKANRKK